MGEPFRTTELETLFDQTRRVLESMRAAGTTPDASGTPSAETSDQSQPPDAEATGEALEGKIRATVSAGRLQALWIEPRAMRIGSAELCEHIVTAVNAALAQAPESPEAVPPLDLDPAALSEQLQSIQERSIRQMSAFGDAMNAVVARLDRSQRT